MDVSLRWVRAAPTGWTAPRRGPPPCLSYPDSPAPPPASRRVCSTETRRRTGMDSAPRLGMSRPMRLKCPLWPLFGLLLALLPAPAPAAPPEAAARRYARRRRRPNGCRTTTSTSASTSRATTPTSSSASPGPTARPIPVHEIVFNAHSHYVVPKKDVGLLAKTLEILRMNPDEGIYTSEAPFDLHHAIGGRAGVAVPLRRRHRHRPRRAAGRAAARRARPSPSSWTTPSTCRRSRGAGGSGRASPS